MSGSLHNYSFTSILRNYGNFEFNYETPIPSQSVSSSSADWGDYDNDGDLDILLAGNNTPNSSLPDHFLY